ncbi:MAG: WYL domain-containing protein, partial [Firmicutes bacterium]|nr:WYL domain-containing protein [Bacillota bacterium]
MSGYSELIKNFEKTRDYMRDFFIYGFKVRGDFGQKSARTYDDEKRRAESWLGDVLRYDDSVRGRQISISADSGRIFENPLYRAYYSKSFTDNDIKLHFFILDVLRDGKALCLKEIADAIDERFGTLFELQTVRNKLKEYVDEGLLKSEKRGKTAFFSISDISSGTTASSNLANALKFFSEAGFFGIIGNGILKMLDIKNDIFFIKHNYIVHTLEDILLPDILKAIDEKCVIEFKGFSTKRPNDIEGRDFTAVPLGIFCSTQTGRRYLAAYIPAQRRFHSFRLDKIKKVKISGEYPGYDTIYEKFTKNLPHCFGVSFGSRHEDGHTEPLIITFNIDDTTEDYVVRRIIREKRCGTFERLC